MTIEPMAMELARVMPWTCAPAGSLWQVTGEVDKGQMFADELAVVGVSPVDGTLRFHLGSGLVVRPHHISGAYPLIAVYLDSPLDALYRDEQQLVDRALTDRDTDRGVSADG